MSAVNPLSKARRTKFVFFFVCLYLIALIALVNKDVFINAQQAGANTDKKNKRKCG